MECLVYTYKKALAKLHVFRACLEYERDLEILQVPFEWGKVIHRALGLGQKWHLVPPIS